MSRAKWCEQAATAAGRAGRNDMVERVRGAMARVQRTDAIVCVVGEFKQGKSSLVNALLGERVCPVDDDLATAVLTAVHHGKQPAAVVHRREGGRRRVEAMAPGEAVTLIAEPRHADVERVDLALPNPLLAGGLALVDVPGWGGINGGGTAAALSFVSLADAVLFVTDASAELWAPELELLRRIRERCATVVACVTKTDLHPEWRRIVDLDRAHLAAAGIDIPVVPVSAALHLAAKARDDALDASSGVPGLLDLLLGEVVPRARAEAVQDAVDVAAATLTSLVALRRVELDALRTPNGINEVVVLAAAAQERVDRLRGPASRWSGMLNERMGQLANDVAFEFRSAIRALTKAIEDQVDAADSARAWDEVGQHLQLDVSAAVERSYAALVAGAGAAAAELGELLDIEFDAAGIHERQAVLSDAPQLRNSEGHGRVGGVGLQAFDALRGASGGVIVLGLLSQTLPAAVGAVLLTNPFTIGLGLFAGGRTLVESRARRIGQKRAQARGAMRQFLDDVQFNVGNELANVARSVHLEIRDRVTAAIEQVHRDAADLAAAAERAHQSDAERHERAIVVEAEIADLEALLAQRPATR